MIKPIFIYGESILRGLSSAYTVGTDLSETIQDLWDTMYNANGAGLAGVQIGISKRIFVIDLPDQEWEQVFINPVIITKSGEDTIMNEGCLSLPNLEGSISRPENISIDYYDENWNHKREDYRGIRSRVIQHEYDHLDGILWIDRIDPGEGVKMIKDLQHLRLLNKK